MNKKVLLFILLSYSLSGWSQSGENPHDRIQPVPEANVYTKLLDACAKMSSVTNGLKLPPGDTVLEAYDVFENFYNPMVFDTISGTALSIAYYESHPYLLIQNSLEVYFVDRLYYSQQEIDSIGLAYSQKDKINSADSKKSKTEYEFMMDNYGRMPLDLIRYNGQSEIDRKNKPVAFRTIEHFSPSLKLTGKKTITLTTETDSCLNELLGNKYANKNSRLFPLSSDTSNLMRKRTLDGYVKIWYSKKETLWQLVSYPYVRSLTFDKNMQYARLAVKLPYLEATVFMRKLNGKWIVISFTKD